MNLSNSLLYSSKRDIFYALRSFILAINSIYNVINFFISLSSSLGILVELFYVNEMLDWLIFNDADEFMSCLFLTDFLLMFLLLYIPEEITDSLDLLILFYVMKM